MLPVLYILSYMGKQLASDKILAPKECSDIMGMATYSNPTQCVGFNINK